MNDREFYKHQLVVDGYIAEKFSDDGKLVSTITLIRLRMRRNGTYIPRTQEGTCTK